MKNSQKGFIVPLLLGIIALLVIGGGAYIYLNHPKTETQSSDEIKSNEIATTNQNVPETTNWKTYQNAKYRFQIKYPTYFSEETSGRPDEGIRFKNNNERLNIAWAIVSLNISMKGPINYEDAAPKIITPNFEKGGIVRILKNFTINVKKAVTYESIGWPSRIPDVTTVIETKDGSIIVDVYGKKEIDINKIKQNDYSEYSDLEHINELMVSTFSQAN